MYIYKTVNLLTGQFYVGKRVYRKKDDQWYLGSGIYLNRAIQKYGRENFKKEIIEWCETDEQLNERERYWIKELRATEKGVGYNLAFGGDGGFTGPESYKKISEKLTGRVVSEEVRKNMSAGLKGVKKHPDHVEKVRQALKGRKRADWEIAKINAALKPKREMGWSPRNKPVFQYDLENGTLLFEYLSAAQAARKLEIDRKGVCNACLNISKSSGGFRWSFEKKQNYYDRSSDSRSQQA